MTDAPAEHRGINRLLAKIKISMENKNFYEGEVFFSYQNNLLILLCLFL